MELLKGRCVTGSVGPGRDRAEPERSGQPFLEAPELLEGVNLVDLNLFRGEGDHVPDDRADKGGKHGRDQPSEHLDASPQTIRPVTTLRVVRGWLGRAVMAIGSRPSVVSGLKVRRTMAPRGRLINLFSSTGPIPRSAAPSPRPPFSVAGPAVSRNSTASQTGLGRTGHETPPPDPDPARRLPAGGEWGSRGSAGAR